MKKHQMMVFGGRWFRQYQKWLLLFANTILGRLILGIPLSISRVRKLTPEACVWSRDSMHYQSRVYAGKQYANRLYFALKPLWWILHTIDGINARQGWRLNFGFDTLNVYSPDGANSAAQGTSRVVSQTTFATLQAGAGNATDSWIRLGAGTTTNYFNTLYRYIVTFKTSAGWPSGAKAAAVSISAATINLFTAQKKNGLGAAAVSLVAASPASNTTIVAADHTTLGTTQFATDKAYADFTDDAYNGFALNAAGLANIDIAQTHSKWGFRLAWDRAASFGGTWAYNAVSGYIVYKSVNQYPYIALTYTVQSAPTITNSIIAAASAGYVAGGFTLGVAAIDNVRLLVDDDPAFGSPDVDTGFVALPTAAGASTRILGVWTPTVAGHYYGKIGIDSAYFQLYGDVVQFDVAFPTITSVARAQSRDTFTWTIVVADTYKQPPFVSMLVDDRAYPAVLTSSGVDSYTYIATASLERGKHTSKTVVANLWQIVESETETFYAEYTLPTPGISIFAGGSKLEVLGASITDAVLPEYPVLTFTSATWLPGDQMVTALCYLRGIKRYEFLRRYATKNENGMWTYRCESVDKRRLEEVTSIVVNAVGIEDVLAQVVAPLRLADEYGTLMPGFLYETKWELVPKNTIVSQLLVQAGVNAWCRSGTLYAHKQDVSAETPRFAVRMTDVQASFSEDAQTFDWVRVWYAILRYPVVVTALTNYDAAQWTGTVSNELRTADGILPPSGSLYCLKGTGSITRASLLANFSDFDRFHLRWCPPSGTTSLSITLQTDASNNLTYTRTFAGGAGAGFNLVGGSGPDGTLTKTITLGSRRLVAVAGQMSEPCVVTMRVKLSGTTVWTSAAIPTAGDNNTFTASVPESIYKGNLMDTLELDFTQLYQVSNSYGVSCVKLDVSEYVQSSQITGSSTRTVSSASIHYRLSPSYVTIGGVGYIRFGKQYLCAKPTVTEGQSMNISYENSQMTLWMVGADGANVNLVTGGGADIVEENGNLYLTASDIERGSDPGDVIDVQDASGTIIVRVTEATFTSILVWVTQTWAWSSSYNLFDDIDLPLSAFTKTGSPTTLVSIILNATGANYYDGLCVYANQPKERYVDAKSGSGSHKMPDRTGDGFGSENAARAFANGLLALVSTPAKDYAIAKPLDTDIELGDPVDCDGETLAVYGIAYDFEQGHMVIRVGKRVQETLEVLKNHAERIDRLENRR